MKLNGFVGKGSGKLGASVFAISGGEQIVRQYNPQVANPNTDAQVAQRAKLKLMSQLAAALAPGLGFKKMGLVSARNQFVSKNIANATFEQGKASINLQGLKLTPGSLAGPTIAAARGTSNDVLNVDLSGVDKTNLSGIVLVSVERTEGENVILLDVKLVKPTGDTWPASETMKGSSDPLTVYSYGIIKGSMNTSALYSDAEVSVDITQAAVDTTIMAAIRNATLTDTNYTSLQEA